MADANTTRYGLVKPEISASADTWGSKLNQDYDDIDVLLGAITTTGSANAYVLTTGLSLAAYVSGQSFLVKANFTNSGAATINVDTLGAKSLVKGVSTALASGDITSGAIYHISYDGTNFNVLNSGGLYQSADATLTALAALSWSSGSPVVQFTAADTVSLTLTPSVSSITTSQGAAAATASATFTNTNDNALVQAAAFQGDRATMAANDEAYVGYYLSDSAGNQDEMVRNSWYATAVTSGSETARQYFWTRSSGTLARRWYFDHINIVPDANDGLALGSTSRGWSDLHLATGGVINWANGLVTLTHDATNDCLEVAAGGFAAPLEQVTGVGGETLTNAAHRNRELVLDGNITLPNSVFAAGDWHVFVGDGSARTITRGASVTMYVNGVDSASATLPARQVGGAVWETASVVYLTGPVV